MDDQKLITLIAGRDEQMLAFAIQKYSRLLWKVAAPILINGASAQDVEECVADAFIYLWQHPEKFDPGRARLSSWLSMVARSRAIDRYRRIAKKREIPLEEIAAGSLGYTGSAPDEEKERLRRCIGELEETEKELITRRYYYEQKPAEIAVALDMPRKQVENRLYYVRQKLKKRMEAVHGEI